MIKIRAHDRIAIFIDGSNLYYSQQNLQLQIDFRRLLEYFTSGGSLLRAFYYTGVDPEDKGQRGFIHWLRLNGFKVIEKPIKRYPDGSTKANLDIELAIDMLALADKYDRAILFTGDGDLTRLVEAVQMKGVRVQVVSTMGMVATELRAAADEFVDLAEVRENIEKSDRQELGIRQDQPNNKIEGSADNEVREGSARTRSTPAPSADGQNQVVDEASVAEMGGNR